MMSTVTVKVTELAETVAREGWENIVVIASASDAETVTVIVCTAKV